MARCRRPLRCPLAFAAIVALVWGRQAVAAPELALDDPVVLRLERLRASGLVPLLALSGIRPLDEAQVQELLSAAGDTGDPTLSWSGQHGPWVRPVTRFTSRLGFAADPGRPFSVPLRPRELEGGVQASCEHQEGRPCGDGGRAMLELDSGAGAGRWASLTTRLRLWGGLPDGQAGVTLAQLAVRLVLGPAELAVGRSVVVVGPGVRTQLLWGDHAPPLDHAALTVRSLPVPRLPVVLGGMALVGRLAAPQRFPGTLVTIARAYAEIGGRVMLGMTNLLELGGNGAPSFSSGQFFREHITRTGPWPGAGISNRRVAFDATLLVSPLRSVLYYELAFEDWRRQFGSALRYDADHLLGWHTPSLAQDGSHGLLVELHRTGVRSQEHGVFSSGMTSGGRPAGSPLGPDALSIFVSPRLDRGRLSLFPWLEYVRIGSDGYEFPEDAAIVRTSPGPTETRWRAGARLLAALRPGLWLAAEAFLERVGQPAFAPGARDNGGCLLTATWSGWRVDTAPASRE